MLPSATQYATMLEKHHPSDADLQGSQIVATNHSNQLNRFDQMKNEPQKHPAAPLNVQLRSVTQGDPSQFGSSFRSSSLPRSARQLAQLDKLGKRYSEVSL